MASVPLIPLACLQSGEGSTSADHNFCPGKSFFSRAPQCPACGSLPPQQAPTEVKYIVCVCANVCVGLTVYLSGPPGL